MIRRPPSLESATCPIAPPLTGEGLCFLTCNRTRERIPHSQVLPAPQVEEALIAQPGKPCRRFPIRPRNLPG